MSISLSINSARNDKIHTQYVNARKGDSVNSQETLESYGSYVTSLHSKIAKAHAITCEHLNTGMQRQKEHYDTKCTGHKYFPGDIVAEMRTEGSCPKLQPPFSGPYIILRCYNNMHFCIQLTKEGKQRVIHFKNNLNPTVYVGNQQIPWINRVRKRMLKKI